MGNASSLSWVYWSSARPICFSLDRQAIWRAFSRALGKNGEEERG